MGEGPPKDLMWVEHFEEYRRTGKRVMEWAGDTWNYVILTPTEQ
ncbi:MAG: hypothetical protein ACTSPR_03790 [Candidatus Thorarchaeota archaeon]